MSLKAVRDHHDLEMDEDFTPITCLACKGDWYKMQDGEGGSYKAIFCNHCLRGGMNKFQQYIYEVSDKKVKAEIYSYKARHDSGVRKRI